jgi:hypothetical protein
MITCLSILYSPYCQLRVPTRLMTDHSLFKDIVTSRSVPRLYVLPMPILPTRALTAIFNKHFNLSVNIFHSSDDSIYIYVRSSRPLWFYFIHLHSVLVLSAILGVFTVGPITYIFYALLPF